MDHPINILPHFDSVIFFYPDINNPIVPNIKEYFTALFSYETKLFQCAIIAIILYSKRGFGPVLLELYKFPVGNTMTVRVLVL